MKASSMDSNLSIIVPAHDSYKDVVILWEKAISKYWSDCPYRIVWANGTERVDSSIIEEVRTGENATFAQRVLNGINAVKTDYVLIWCEDFILSKPVQTESILAIVDLMREYGFVHCRLLKTSKCFSTKMVNCKNKYLSNDNKPYGLSINVGIFQTAFLTKIIDPKWTGWDIEQCFLKLSKEGKIHNCIYDDADVGGLVHLIQKGKIIPNAEETLIKLGYDTFYLVRERMSSIEAVQYSLKTTLSQNLPPQLRNLIKSIADKLGFKMTTPY